MWSQRVLIKIYERASRISSYIPSLCLSPNTTLPLFFIHAPLLSLSLSFLFNLLLHPSFRSSRQPPPLTTRVWRTFLSFVPPFECHRARIRGIRNELAPREFTRHGIGPSVYFTLGSRILGAVLRILGGCGFNRRSC